MTKQEYILGLNEALINYPEDFRKEILEAFEGHFQEGLDNGLSEEEVIDTLGSIDEVVSNIEMMNGNMNTYSPSDAIRDNMTSLQKNIKELTRSITEAVNNTINAEFSFEKKFEKKDTKPTYHEIPNSETINTISVTGKLDINVRSGDNMYCEFSPQVSIFSKYLPVIEIHEDNNQVFINLPEGDGTLNLYISPNIKTLKISTPSGDSELTNLNLDLLTVESRYGDVHLSRINSKEIDVSCSSGDIHISDTSAHYIEAISVSGDVYVANGNASLALKSTSGDIEVFHFLAQTIEASSVSGDVEINADFKKATLKATSGDIEINSLGSIDSLHADTTSGDIELTIKETDIKLLAKTFSGDVELGNFPYQKISGNEYIIGNGKGLVSLSTKAGDIAVMR